MSSSHLTPRPRPPAPPDPRGYSGVVLGRLVSGPPFRRPSLPSAIRSVSLVIKAEKREAAGGETSGRASDEFSEINTVCWGGFDGGIKMSALAKLLPTRARKAPLKTNPRTDVRSAVRIATFAAPLIPINRR